MPENCERARKTVKEPGKVRETMQMISFFIRVFQYFIFLSRLVVKEHV